MVRDVVRVLAVLLTLAIMAPAGYAYGQRGGKGGGGRGGGGGGGGQAPRVQVNPAIAQDQQAIVTSMTDQTKAQTALDTAVKKLQKEFEESADVTAAQKTLADAQADLAKAREAVLAKLKTNASYKSAADKEAAANAKIADLQKKHAAPDAIAQANTDAFKLSAVTDKMERDALSSDADYSAAKAKVVDSNKALADLRKTFNDGLKDNADLKPLYDAKDAAVAKVTEAQNKLKQDSSVAGR